MSIGLIDSLTLAQRRFVLLDNGVGPFVVNLLLYVSSIMSRGRANFQVSLCTLSGVRLCTLIGVSFGV
jgi:hypothetical protein